MNNKNNISSLAENYKRVFGEIPASDNMDRKVKLTENKKSELTPEQLNTWVNIHKKFSNAYPNKVLVMKEGKIMVDGFIVESTDKFFRKDSYGMIESIKSVAQKLNG